MIPILVSVAVLGSLAIAGAVMLYYTSKNSTYRKIRGWPK